MKKIISLALVFVMLLSVMPMAFAADETLREQYVQEFIKMIVYCSNYYDDTSFRSDLLDWSNDYLENNNITEISYDKKWLDENEDKLEEYTKSLKELNSKTLIIVTHRSEVMDFCDRIISVK